MAEKMTHEEACIQAREYFLERISALEERAYNLDMERRDDPGDWEYDTECLEAIWAEINTLRSILSGL